MRKDVQDEFDQVHARIDGVHNTVWPRINDLDRYARQLGEIVGVLLPPCPSCGGAASVRPRGRYGEPVALVCSQCGLTGPTHRPYVAGHPGRPAFSAADLVQAWRDMAAERVESPIFDEGAGREIHEHGPLQSCPVCNAAARLMAVGMWYRVVCGGCGGVRTGLCGSKAAAEAEWNCRGIPWQRAKTEAEAD